MSREVGGVKGGGGAQGAGWQGWGGVGGRGLGAGVRGPLGGVLGRGFWVGERDGERCRLVGGGCWMVILLRLGVGVVLHGFSSQGGGRSGARRKLLACRGYSRSRGMTREVYCVCVCGGGGCCCPCCCFASVCMATLPGCE